MGVELHNGPDEERYVKRRISTKDDCDIVGVYKWISFCCDAMRYALCAMRFSE